MVWAWAFPANMVSEDGTVEISPPFACDADGNVISVGYEPDHVVLLLDEHLDHREMQEVMEHHSDIRWRKDTDGKWTLRIQRKDPITGEKNEEDHPLQRRVIARRPLVAAAKAISKALSHLGPHPEK